MFRKSLNLVGLLVALVVALGGLVAVSSSPALADTPPVTQCPDGFNPSTYNFNVGAATCVKESESNSSSTASDASKAHSVNGVRINAKGQAKVLSFITAKGMPKAQQTNCITLKHGGSYNTSYYNIYHQEVWKMKYYPAGKKFCRGSDGYDHDPVCNNKVTGLPRGPSAPPKAHIQVHGKFKIVKRFKFDVESESKVGGSVKVESFSWANLYDNNGNLTCHSFGRGEGSASYGAVGKARIRGRVFTSLKAALSAAVSGSQANLAANMQGQTVVQLRAKAVTSASGKAVAGASSGASCIETIPPEELTCPEVYGPGYGGDYPNCTKDGTTTPEPPDDVPGPNPDPSDPGNSNQCYSETTGLPVTPNPDGTCPPGSFGG